MSNGAPNKVTRQDINVDMMNVNRFINPESAAGKMFDMQMHKLMDRLWQKCPEQKEILSGMTIHFCIQDNQDQSVARVMDSNYPIEVWNLNGNNFVVAFTKEKLGLLKNEDEAAFVMGHELSHLLYRNNAPRLPELYDEETSCDLNSLQRMAEAGMNLESALRVDDIYEQKFTNQKRRTEERKDLMAKIYEYHEPTPHNFDLYRNVSYQPLSYDFKMPGINDSEENKIAKMEEGLRAVFAIGDREGYRKQLKAHFDKVGSEEASRQVLILTAKIFSDFVDVDFVKKARGYRTYLNHPLCVVTEVVDHVNRMKGKKLFPPEAVNQIRNGLKRNPFYLQGTEKVWNEALGSRNMPIYGKEGR